MLFSTSESAPKSRRSAQSRGVGRKATQLRRIKSRPRSSRSADSTAGGSHPFCAAAGTWMISKASKSDGVCHGRGQVERSKRFSTRRHRHTAPSRAVRASRARHTLLPTLLYVVQRSSTGRARASSGQCIWRLANSCARRSNAAIARPSVSATRSNRARATQHGRGRARRARRGPVTQAMRAPHKGNRPRLPRDRAAYAAQRAMRATETPRAERHDPDRRKLIGQENARWLATPSRAARRGWEPVRRTARAAEVPGAERARSPPCGSCPAQPRRLAPVEPEGGGSTSS